MKKHIRLHALISGVVLFFGQISLASEVTDTPKKKAMHSFFKGKNPVEVFKGTRFGAKPIDELKAFLEDVSQDDLDKASNHGEKFPLNASALPKEISTARVALKGTVIASKIAELEAIFVACPAGDDPKNYLSKDDIRELANKHTGFAFDNSIKSYVPTKKTPPKTPKKNRIDAVLKPKKIDALLAGTKGTYADEATLKNGIYTLLCDVSQAVLDAATDYGTELDSKKVLDQIKGAKKKDLRAIFPAAGADRSEYLLNEDIDELVNSITKKAFNDAHPKFPTGYVASARPVPSTPLDNLLSSKDKAAVIASTTAHYANEAALIKEVDTILGDFSQVELDTATDFGTKMDGKDVLDALVDAKKKALALIFPDCPAGKNNNEYVTAQDIIDLVNAATKKAFNDKFPAFPGGYVPSPKPIIIETVLKTKDVAKVLAGTKGRFANETALKKEVPALLSKFSQDELDAATDYGAKVDPKVVLTALVDSKKKALALIFPDCPAGGTSSEYLTSTDIESLVNVITTNAFNATYPVFPGTYKASLKPNKNSKPPINIPDIDGKKSSSRNRNIVLTFLCVGGGALWLATKYKTTKINTAAEAA